MRIINLDIPLLILGILLIIIYWFRGRRVFTRIGLFFASTFNAQYSLGVSWSLAKLSGFLLALDGINKRPRALKIFIPYVWYVFLATLISSFFWEIPNNVNIFYGEGRVFVSLFNFSILVFATMSLAVAFADGKGAATLWFFLRWLGIIHGTFSLCQVIALKAGFPLIGISRPHGLTFDGKVADIAIFLSQTGINVIRPGGLAGEPKTTAVIFGIVLISIIYLGWRLDKTRPQKTLTVLAGGLSAFGFLSAFSTSAFLGLGVSLFFIPFIFKGKFLSKIIVRSSVFVGIGTILLICIYSFSIDIIPGMIEERTVDRFEKELDPPVMASLRAIEASLKIALFGTGAGGSSFVIMDYFNTSFEYSYAPNVGIILMLVEQGFLGTILFFSAYSILTIRALKSFRINFSDGKFLLIVVSISTVILCMSGSGIPLGFPLGIAAMYGAQVGTRL